MNTKIQVKWKKKTIILLAIVTIGALSCGSAMAQVSTLGQSANSGTEKSADFVMLPSNGLPPGVLKNAKAHVHVRSVGPVEIMEVFVQGLPPNTDFDFFVIQVPNKPFGLAWYQGDIETNRNGVGFGSFVGRFSIETFIVATGIAPAPVVHFDDPQPFPDADHNPATNPVQLYHLGLWFNSPADAAKAGAGNGVTPFNGEHNAGAQVLSTNGFPDAAGPLKQLN
jgi:hypothetical protein